MSLARQEAMDFVENEKQFHLGFLPTEQSHPKTEKLSQVIQRDTAAGILMLQSVDQDILPVARQIFAGGPFSEMVESFCDTLKNGGRIFFSGCGSTGRLSIQLEAAWRQFWQERKADRASSLESLADLEDRVLSVMTGGDRALIRSVENFEDFVSFGRQQLVEHDVTQKDVVVGISEGGETSSVIGTVLHALDVGARVFFVYNNPSEVLRQHIDRSRQVIEDARVTTLDLTTGPMAVAGSTRMQATTCELLVVGAALELALTRFLGDALPQEELAEFGVSSGNAENYCVMFEQLLAQLSDPAAVDTLARLTEFEESIYRENGLVTYMSHDYLLDIFTDTTERAPTFMLPPFRKADDKKSARPWAFVKNPVLSSVEAWRKVFRRPLRGLAWDSKTYKKLGAPAGIWKTPPPLDNSEILKYRIGNEDDPSRYQDVENAAVMILVGEEVVRFNRAEAPIRMGFKRLAGKYSKTAVVSLGRKRAATDVADHMFHISCDFPASPMGLWKHLGIKLVLNTTSTATMTRMGRIEGNWMICAEATNKKLIDRGTRLVKKLTGLEYEEACVALHESMEIIKRQAKSGEQWVAPAAMTISRIRQRN